MISLHIRKAAARPIRSQIEYFQKEAPHIVAPFRRDIQEILFLLETFPLTGRPGSAQIVERIKPSLAPALSFA